VTCQDNTCLHDQAQKFRNFIFHIFTFTGFTSCSKMRLDQVDTRIFLTGATGRVLPLEQDLSGLLQVEGYIGGTVLSRLIAHPKSDTFRITVLIRSPEKAAQFKQLGLKTVVGSLGDTKLVETLAADADVVFNCANADDLPASRAILDGLKARHLSKKKLSTLIHTSGTGVLMKDVGGMHGTDEVYSDLDVEKIESLPLNQPHRNVDTMIVSEDERGHMRSYIILPSTIWGISTTSLADIGLQNSRSQQIPNLVRVCLDRGQGGMIGLGKNVWPNVNIDELAELYILLLDAVLDNDVEDLGHGRSGYYFAENGEHQMIEIGRRIAEDLCSMGKGRSPVPHSFDSKEMAKYFPNGTSLGTNSRCRADRSRRAGWEPTLSTDDMLDSIRDEIKAEVELCK